MNKTLAITAIVLVAVVMGMSTIAPAMAWMPEADIPAQACQGIERAPPGTVPTPIAEECAFG